MATKEAGRAVGAVVLVGALVKVETWDGIPPASERYDEARDAMRTRIERLLGSLRATKPRR